MKECQCRLKTDKSFKMAKKDMGAQVGVSKGRVSSDSWVAARVGDFLSRSIA